MDPLVSSKMRGTPPKFPLAGSSSATSGVAATAAGQLAVGQSAKRPAEASPGSAAGSPGLPSPQANALMAASAGESPRSVGGLSMTEADMPWVAGFPAGLSVETVHG